MSKIYLLGDVAFNGLFSDDPDNNSKRFFQIMNFFKDSDLIFANLEFPVKEGFEQNEYKKFIHYAEHEQTYNLLKLLNIGCVSLANNHIYDYKLLGLKATINILDELGIYHTGAGWREEHIKPVIIDKNGCKIGFIAYVDKSTNPKTENFQEFYINDLESKKIVNDIKYLSKKVDKIICSLHWGNDYSNYHTRNQQKVAYEIIDAGADVIMGHHPHTIQSLEKYKQGIIFYSLGQLCFGDFYWEGKLRALKRKTKKGMIVQFNDPELKIFNLIPTHEKKGNFISIPQTDLSRKIKCLSKINKLSLKNSFCLFLVNIKENVFDRLYEYFFGYYRNPLRQFINVKNYTKATYIIRDVKKGI